MLENNPFALFETLSETLNRYIPTTLPISRRYPNLRKEFRKRLSQQTLVKGPYVEALPDFEKASSLSELLISNGGFIHDSLSALPESILNRPLHKHQEIAFKSACQDRDNLLVATGTGSGKTETFLYPMAHHLLNDPDPDAPGVRCLLIYPMNALANDQLYYRIAPLFGTQLAEAGITFGRFTSQIKANTPRDEEEARLHENDKLMRALGNPSQIPSNWLLTREEMLETPPKILITNYAMLEHLLLLPRNAPLFSQATLQSIVLDEIHTYSGAQATEVAFLLRKLKNRLGITYPLQVYGTSASLPAGEENDEKICRFASNLFDEPFTRVIRGTRIPHQRLTGTESEVFSLNIKTWQAVGRVLNNLVAHGDFDEILWAEEIENEGITSRLVELPSSNQSFVQKMEHVFSKNREIRVVSQILDNGGVQSFRDVAKQVFDIESTSEEAGAYEALSAIIHLGMLARSDENSFPLLPGRYHLAVNGIEGVAIQLTADNKEGWAQLKLLRTFQDEGGIYFPLMVCRKCGQPYIECFEHKRKLHNRRPLTEGGRVLRRIFWLGSPPDTTTIDEDEDEERVTEDAYKKIFIDPDDGLIVKEKGTNTVSLYEVVTKKDEDEKANYLNTCPACGGRSSGADAEVITRMHPGNEALGAVVTQKVLESLPAIEDNANPKPMAGRNLLAFSDNRQNAAFFAPYFERTAGNVAVRSGVIQSLQNNNDYLQLDDLTDNVYKVWQRQGQPVMLDESGTLITGKQKVLELLKGKIASEFFTPGGRRNSLEALGLVRISIERTTVQLIKDGISERYSSDLSSEDEDGLIDFFVETLIREKAVGRIDDVDMKSAYIWGIHYSNHRAFSEYADKQRNAKINGWVPVEGTKRHNRRTWYLIEQLGWSWEEARMFLLAFWEVTKQIKFLIPLKPGFGVDVTKLRFKSSTDLPLFICKNCGLRQANIVKERCTAFRCKGQVEALSHEERGQFNRQNHYVFSYLEGKASTARAREHTASLSTELREEIEREFSDGKINLLSCTTTMEMGVDLGDLEAVINLNIPPGIGNYQQRTGRAGRRAQAAPVSVTVARNSQYDQMQFRDFQNYLDSTNQVPFLLLDNAQLFRRHQTGIILSGFLRYRIQNTERNAPLLSDLFCIEGEIFDKNAYNSFLEDLNHWLESKEGDTWVVESLILCNRLPKEVETRIGISKDSLIRHFKDQLMAFADEVHDRWKIYTDKIDIEKNNLDDNKAVARLQSWMSMRKRFFQQLLVDQLSRRSLIPTYSFPVHSLTLDVVSEQGRAGGWGQGGDVSLSRDASLGISEYAPGADVVANGRIWSSAGIAFYPKMFMPTEYYIACPECHHVDIGVAREDLPNECSNCNSTSGRRKRAYIKPRGFVTAYSDRKGKDPGTNRRKQRSADEARLISIPEDEQFMETDHTFITTVLLRAIALESNDRAGSMFIVNRGPHGHGYNICKKCNYATPAKEPKPRKIKHKEPLTGNFCQADSFMKTEDLAHEFNTDVLMLRFSLPVPKPESENARQEIDSFIRTLSEALRFAATGLLEVQSTELRATPRLRGNHVDIIIYDSVSGGAGYCVQLQNEISKKVLVQAAINRLDCVQDCSTACSGCLCDYSNQMMWDQLDRIPVLQWLQGIQAGNIKDPIEELGAVRWNTPSLAGITEQISNSNEIHLVGQELDASVSDSEEGNNKIRKWIQDRCDSGTKIIIHLTKEFKTGTAHLTAHQRDTLRYLLPYIKSGKLSIGLIKNLEKINLNEVPRIFVNESKGRIFYSSDTSPALLKNILPTAVYQAELTTKVSELVSEIINATKIYPAEHFSGGNPIDRWKVLRGQPRDFESYFKVIKGEHVKNVVIMDPYCGDNVSSLVALVKQIKSMAKDINYLTVQSRERHRNDKNWRPTHQISRDLIKELKPIHEKLTIRVKEFNRSHYFHDRTLDFEVINTDGTTVVHQYDLTGGIDILMNDTDRGKNTTVYRYMKDT